MKYLVLLALIGSAFAQYDPLFEEGHFGIVHLFEWHWSTIAEECERFLGPKKFGGVQISPPTENRIVDSRPWWERYQPISYGMTTRSGDEAALRDMVSRCNAVGVRVYADIVINHMCGNGGSGTGTGGTYFNANHGQEDFPGVPYGKNDFNSCKSNIENYGDPNDVRNCELVGLLDLNQGKDYVRGKIIDMMNHLLDMGIAGFRVDACKHMWPGDLQVIFQNTDDAFYQGSGIRPYIYQEVIDQGNEPIKASEYTGLGQVTEFKYCGSVGNNADTVGYLSTVGESWGFMSSHDALIFLNNHDNQRGHGGGGHVVTFEEPEKLKALTAYMLAYDYAIPRIMSSYYFSNGDQGPPPYQPSAYKEGNTECDNGWVCEHRWYPIRNMPQFAAVALSDGMDAYSPDSSNQKLVIKRGSSALLVLNQASYGYDAQVTTTMPDGCYCNVYTNDASSNCKDVVYVSGGSVSYIMNGKSGIAIHVDATCSGSSGGGSTGGGSTGGGSTGTTCTDCDCPSSQKIDCGELSSTQSSCEADGCLWCPAQENSNDPWCFYADTSSGGDSGGSSSSNDCADCSCDVSARKDCGFMGITEQQCVNDNGCYWCEVNDGSTPWCFYPL